MYHFPRKITKLVRMRWKLESIREWNRFGGCQYFINIVGCSGKECNRDLRKEERDFRRRNRKMIRERKICFWEALKMVLNA